MRILHVLILMLHFLMFQSTVNCVTLNCIKTKHIADDGVSGIIFDRPAFKEMMKNIEDGKINCVIVKELSRFGRNSIETGYFIEMVFPLFHTRFISVSDGFDSNDCMEDTGGMEIAWVVKLIFDTALTMNSVNDIVKVLLEKKIPTPGEYRKSNGKEFNDVSRTNGKWCN